MRRLLGALALIAAAASDAELLYASSLEVARQWFDCYHVTQERRHLHTALVCAAIGRERYVLVAAERRRLGTVWPGADAQAALAAHLAGLAKTLGGMAS